MWHMPDEDRLTFGSLVELAATQSMDIMKTRKNEMGTALNNITAILNSVWLKTQRLSMRQPHKACETLLLPTWAGRCRLTAAATVRCGLRSYSWR
jgi:hypothetical protein